LATFSDISSVFLAIIFPSVSSHNVRTYTQIVTFKYGGWISIG